MGSCLKLFVCITSEVSLALQDRSLKVKLTFSCRFKVSNIPRTYYGDIINKIPIRKNIFTCLFSVHDTISLSSHEQVCLIRLRFERYFSHYQYLSKRSLIKYTCSWRVNLSYYNTIPPCKFHRCKWKKVFTS